jgi:hypothetical protein
LISAEYKAVIPRGLARLTNSLNYANTSVNVHFTTY